MVRPPEPSILSSFVVQLLSTRPSQCNGGESAALASMWSLFFDDEILDLVSFHRMYSIMQLVEDLLYLQRSHPLSFQCKTPRLFSLPLIVHNSSFVAICVHCFLQAERRAIVGMAYEITFNTVLFIGPCQAAGQRPAQPRGGGDA